MNVSTKEFQEGFFVLNLKTGKVEYWPRSKLEGEDNKDRIYLADDDSEGTLYSYKDGQLYTVDEKLDVKIAEKWPTFFRGTQGISVFGDFMKLNNNYGSRHHMSDRLTIFKRAPESTAIGIFKQKKLKDFP